MRLSYLGVRLGESIPRIYFSTDFDFKAHQTPFCLGLVSDGLHLVSVGTLTSNGAGPLVLDCTGLLGSGLAPELPARQKGKEKVGAGERHSGGIPEDPWSTCFSQRKWNLPASLCGLLALGDAFGSDSITDLA